MVVGLVIELAMFWGTNVVLLRRRYFWLLLALFLLYVTAIDLVALRMDWWRFNPDRIVGITLVGIPIEEYLLGILFCLFTISVWENLDK